MKADLKQKWIEALESGKYPKGDCALNSEGKYCCIGVLCDIVAPGGWGAPRLNEQNNKLTMPHTLEKGIKSGIMGDEIMSETGLELVGLPSHMQDDLVDLNDSNDTFAPIVEYIRENVRED